MFFWPKLELSKYEQKFVSVYDAPAIKENKAKGIKGQRAKPGVKRRAYKVLLNNTAHSGVTGLENIHLNGQVQISRSARVFALTFTGDLHAWRLRIFTASGTDFTPRLPGGTYPMVSALSPGASWNAAASTFAQPGNLTINAIPTRQIAWMQLPLILDPNWELDPNESLLFEGEAIAPQEEARILEIAVHVWEFPGMVRGMEGPSDEIPRTAGGPSLGDRSSPGQRC